MRQGLEAERLVDMLAHESLNLLEIEAAPAAACLGADFESDLGKQMAKLVRGIDESAAGVAGSPHFHETGEGGDQPR